MGREKERMIEEAHAEQQESMWIYYDEDDYEVPESPFDVFEQSHCILKKILSHGMPVGLRDEIYKMIFVQSIAALEAYFCDTLIVQISKDKEAFKKAESELKVSEDLVIKKLKNKIYHNLKFLHRTYKNILNIDINTKIDTMTIIGENANLNEPQPEELKKLIQIRHDCVHRNGKDKDGNPVLLGKREVKEALKSVYTFIKNVEEKVWEIETERECSGLESLR